MSAVADQSDLDQLLITIAQRADALRLLSTSTLPADRMLETFVADIATQLRDEINLVIEQLGLEGAVTSSINDAAAPRFRQ